MSRVIRITVLLMLLLTVSTPASAAGYQGNSFHGSIDGWETGFSPGPNEGRCPAGTEWMLFSAGVGEAAGYGTFVFEEAHCSRVLTLTPQGAIGKLSAGSMTLTFDDSGDELHIAFTGTWRYDGDLATGEGTAKVHQSWTVMGDASTGMFEGAEGHGAMQGVSSFHRILFELDGGLILSH
ncbi:MAG: hypothetical protein OEY55_08055 [Acidimicrobiia bacterium]|nr:hypothetical protein [Acidimicrobiia bacterium]MDH5504030.1 hypothetical protein [Acidimicrobiia bacterium]